jgi:predicted nucleotidyltransferase
MAEPEESRPHLILPVGTQVVSRIELRDARGNVICPAGAVGEVILALLDGTHSYRIRLPDGREVALRRNNLTIHKHTQREDLAAEAAVAERDLWDCVIYRCVTGSQAYGLAGEGSDVDRRGFYLPPADLQWSLYGVPEQLEKHETQEVYWEIRKFLTMALKADPNVLECLYTPLVETCSPLAEELRENRGRLLSKLMYRTYNGYTLSQFRRLEQDLRTTGKLNWKHAMHLIRILLAGIAAVETGEIAVRVPDDLRERLLKIRRGEIAWKEIDAWRLELHSQFDEAFARSPLPERPDYAWTNQFLIRARRSAL